MCGACDERGERRFGFKRLQRETVIVEKLMSFLDKIASGVMPAASDEKRAEARRRIEGMAPGNAWLEKALQHHRRIEAGFAEAMNAAGADSRRKAFKELAVILTGHANAEEAVLYPAVVEHSGKAQATMAYEEQAVTKVQMARLEQIDPASQEWRDKLEHIKSAVEQHVYQEESSWFPDLVERVPAEQRNMLAARFAEEFDRYCGQRGVAADPAAALQST